MLDDPFLLLPAEVQLRLNLLVGPLNAVLSLEGESLLLFNLLQLILQCVHLGHQEGLLIPCHRFARNHICVLHLHILQFLLGNRQFFDQFFPLAFKFVDVLCNQPQLLRHLFQIVKVITAWQSINPNLTVTEDLV